MEYRRARADGASRHPLNASFTGAVWLDPILTSEGIIVHDVFFEPGARTFWHRHSGGQLLTFTHGHGMVHNRDGQGHEAHAGDTVFVLGGEEHWHGAAPDAFVIHHSVGLGKTEWLEEVDEANYLESWVRARNWFNQAVVPQTDRSKNLESGAHDH
jgi:quercetin dioxygenase-like cupin family protein